VLEEEEALRELARFVREGGVVVFPTESSYALGADPASPAGVAAVFRMKKRSVGKPLPVVAASIEAFEELGIEGAADGFSGLEAAWPGALTIVVPCREALPASCGRKELAVRIPGHLPLRRLLARIGVALTATSANLAGSRPLLELQRLDELVGDERVVVIDGGRLEGGAPSTLVRLEGNSATVLRHGAIDLETLRGLAPSLCFEDDFSADAVGIPVEESD
jgi:L-threonylcarbamoyladenylate synthase